MYLYVLISCSLFLHGHRLWVVRLSSRAGGGCSVTLCRVLGTMDGTGIHYCMTLFLMHCIIQTWELKAFLKYFIKAIEHQSAFLLSYFLLQIPSNFPEQLQLCFLQDQEYCSWIFQNLSSVQTWRESRTWHPHPSPKEFICYVSSWHVQSKRTRYDSS